MLIEELAEDAQDRAHLEVEISQARNQQLKELVEKMANDLDGPRLFLSTIIVLFSSKYGKGLLYATGKFAPRLLKVLKVSLDDEQVKSLERIKDAVKAGTVSEGDRVEMRSIAAEALQLNTEPTSEDV